MKSKKNNTSNQSLANQNGQILLEIIIVMLLVIFISLAITQTVASSLKGVSRARSQTTAVFLAREIAEATRAIAKEDWHNISNLATSSDNKYWPQISGGKWIASTTTENVSLNDLTYNRYFFITDVFRSTSTGDLVSSGGYYDPSTAKININISWTDKDGGAQVFTQAVYLSRFLNQIYFQTNWSEGSIGEVVTTTASGAFATSNNINFASTTGSIKLKQQ